MRRFVPVFLTLVSLAACSRPELRHAPSATVTTAAATPAPSAPPAADPPPSEPPPPRGPAVVEQLAQDHDHPISLVRGDEDRKLSIVFMGGVCSNAFAYLSGFPEAARAHGGVLAIEGDQPCGAPNSGYHSYSWDAAKQNARIEAALARAGASVPPGGLTLVGYSAGAGIGEQMVQRWPDRYARVVLIGAPTDPSTQRLKGARGVVTMSCTLDVPLRMKEAARRLNHAGVPATYLEMPGCRHGNLADGERVMGSAFAWLDENQRSAGGT
ncbi:MAG: alpha/beta hydrolase [Deltaproteobacteria bacterium]|nr:alpha/beta hydrolase [Deltaproteobacteria bacterium]